MDVITDIRDLSHDMINWEWSWSHAGKTALDTIGLIPVIGSVKNADEAASIVNGVAKHGDEVLDSGGKIVKHGNQFVEGVGKTSVNYGDQYGKVGNKKILKSDVECIDSNGYKYTTDSNGRISNVQGDLQLGNGARNEYAQRTVGGTDRLPEDDGGHLISSQFNGSGQIDNLVPQGSGINRAGGEWYKMEQGWSAALKEGGSVKVDITPNYSGSSVRPYSFDVNYWIDGEFFIKNIKNP